MTAPEEAELERRARTDAALREAWAGLQDHSVEDHAPRLDRMLARARPVATRRSLFRRYAAAATVLVLLGIAALLLPRYFTEAGQAPIAMELESVEDAAPPETVRSPAPPAPKSTEPATLSVPSDAASPEPTARRQTVRPSVEAQQNTPPPAVEEETAPRVMRKPEAPAANEISSRPSVPAPELSDASAAIEPPRPAVRLPKLPQTVTGRITDEDGTPLPAADVKRRGLPTGTTTDSSGRFTLPFDATLDQLVITHPEYEEETIDVVDTSALMQISLSEKPARTRYQGWSETAAVTRVPLDNDRITRPQARPEEGYRELRRRIEENRPQEIPIGRVKVDFLVNADGSLSDFRFRGQPDRATMDYVGNALVESSTWEVVRGEAPVRVYFTLRFE